MGLFNRLSNWLVSWLFNSVPELPSPPPGPAPAPPFTPTAVEQNLLILHNEARKGLNPLSLNPKLNKAAGDYARLMAGARKMGHNIDGTSFDQRAAQAGYPNAGAENVAMGYATSQAVFNGWMNSTGHRRNILGPYYDVGFGYAQDDRGTAYWCAVFGWGVRAMSTITLPNEPLVDPALRTRHRKINVRGSRLGIMVIEQVEKWDE